MAGKWQEALKAWIMNDLMEIIEFSYDLDKNIVIWVDTERKLLL